MKRMLMFLCLLFLTGCQAPTTGYSFSIVENINFSHLVAFDDIDLGIQVSLNESDNFESILSKINGYNDNANRENSTIDFIVSDKYENGYETGVYEYFATSASNFKHYFSHVSASKPVEKTICIDDACETYNLNTSKSLAKFSNPDYLASIENNTVIETNFLGYSNLHARKGDKGILYQFELGNQSYRFFFPSDGNLNIAFSLQDADGIIHSKIFLNEFSELDFAPPTDENNFTYY
ncbi:MAG TPA: hypothetical protein VIK55_01420 [Paludibacter sp.]